MKKIITLFMAVLLVSLLSVGVFAQTTAPLLVDNADVLSDTEEAELLDYLSYIKAEHRLDIVVLTVESLDGVSPQDYADDYYDYNGYSYDGVLLLICPESGDGHISTAGYGMYAVNDAGIRKISTEIAPMLTDGNYYEAFDTYAEYCDEFINLAKDGTPYDEAYINNVFNPVKSFFVSLFLGLIIAFFITLAMKNQLKTVKFKENASEYVKRGSLNVTHSRDLYLYSSVTRTAKPKDRDSSSSHRSSSGRSHGGGSFKF